MTATAAAPPAEESTRLRRSVTGSLLFLFILGDVLGAGVYALVGEVAAEAGGAIWAPLFVALILALHDVSVLLLVVRRVKEWMAYCTTVSRFLRSSGT